MQWPEALLRQGLFVFKMMPNEMNIRASLNFSVLFSVAASAAAAPYCINMPPVHFTIYQWNETALDAEARQALADMVSEASIRFSGQPLCVKIGFGKSKSWQALDFSNRRRWMYLKEYFERQEIRSSFDANPYFQADAGLSKFDLYIGACRK